MLHPADLVSSPPGCRRSRSLAAHRGPDPWPATLAAPLVLSMVIFATGLVGPGFTHPVAASPGQLVPVSVAAEIGDSAGERESDEDLSNLPAISADGRFVAFASYTPNMVPGQVDTNNATDVFLWDRVTGTTTLVSHSTAGPTTTANGRSDSPVISGDGALVIFVSQATDLISGTDRNGRFDVFLFERSSGTVTLVSHAAAGLTTAGNDGSAGPTISADGAFVAFASGATDLVGGPGTRGKGNIFLYEHASGKVTLVSHAAAGPDTAANASSAGTVISADGAFVAFQSNATNLIRGTDTNGTSDVFVYERASGKVTLVSHSTAGPTTAGNDLSGWPTISADGAFVGFTSQATDLVAGPDTNGKTDVFVYERASGKVALVSHAATGPDTAGNDSSGVHAISADGAFVVFGSGATDLVDGFDTDYRTSDVFLYERASGKVTLVSHSTAGPNTTGNYHSWEPVISADGALVIFVSRATDLLSTPDPGYRDSRIDHGDLEYGFDSGDVFLYERASGKVTLVSRSTAGPTTTPNKFSGAPVISRDAAFVAFASRATDLVAGRRVSPQTDVYLFDRVSGSTTLVSQIDRAHASATANDHSRLSSVSEDGRYAVFVSAATNLVPGQVDGNNRDDVFLYDRVTGTVTLVSHSAAGPHTTGTGCGDSPVISADGTYVAFEMASGGTSNVYLYERAFGTVTLVSHSAADPAQGGNGGSWSPAISRDGSSVAFESTASDLVGGTAAGTGAKRTSDIFLYERSSGRVTLVSHSTAGPNTGGNSSSHWPVISGDGGLVAFESMATDLVHGPDRNRGWAGASPLVIRGDRGGIKGTWGWPDVFLYDHSSGAVTLVSHSTAGPNTTGNDASNRPVISEDGRLVAFESEATDLVRGPDRNRRADVFLYDRSSGTVTLVSHSTIGPTTAGCADCFAYSNSPAISRDGAYVAFESGATDLIDGTDDNHHSDVFLYQRASGKVTLVSHATASPTTTGNGSSSAPAISGDGAYVAFRSTATDLVADSEAQGIFLYERSSGTVRRVSRSAADPMISGDGAFVAFHNEASDLLERDFNACQDVFLVGPDLDADLVLSRTDAGDPVAAGKELAYTFEVTNLGPGPAAQVRVVDTLPAGARFEGAGGDGWSCEEIAGQVICYLTFLAAATSAAPLTIRLTAPAQPGTLANGAAVSSVAPDPRPDNNSTTAETTVLGHSSSASHRHRSPRCSRSRK